MGLDHVSSSGFGLTRSLMKRCVYVRLRSVSIGVLLNTTYWAAVIGPGIMEFTGEVVLTKFTFPKLKNLAGDKGVT